MENKEFEEAAKTLTLHDLQLSDFMYNTKDYFRECFAILNTTDKFIQKIFTEGKLTYNYNSFNNHLFGIILYNNIVNRMKCEHRITSEHNEHEYGFTHSIDYENKTFQFNYVPAHNQECYARWQYDNRASGKSTRLADSIIQDAFRNYGQDILIQDHYSENVDYIMASRNRGYHNIVNRRPSDRMLFDCIRRRLERELPSNVYDLFVPNAMRGTIKFNYDMSQQDKLRYNLFE